MEGSDRSWDEGRRGGGGGMGRTFGADAHFTLGVCFEETFDTTTRELFGGHMSAIFFNPHT